MFNSNQLIERLRKTLPRQTNYAVAQALGMSQSALNQVLQGKCGFGAESVQRLSEALRMDLGEVLALVEEDKAKTPEKKEFWRVRAPRLSATVLIALTTAAAVIPDSAPPGQVTPEGLRSIHYAKY
jgi:transcriptional regulator with XRE-family HTH domain